LLCKIDDETDLAEKIKEIMAMPKGEKEIMTQKAKATVRTDSLLNEPCEKWPRFILIFK